MKILKLLSLFLLLPLVFHAQRALTGVWTGTLTNDSNTIRSEQSFEIALTQYKEKVYGYSRTTFIVRDTLYYMVKRVKGTIDGDICEIKDDDIISNNFRGKIDKGIKVTTTFRLNKQDTTWRLDGEWKTNKTKNFYSISGKAELKEETDLEKSKILPHLEELNVAKEIPFYVDSKKPAPPVKTQSAPPANPVATNKPITPSIEKTVSKKEDPKPLVSIPPVTIEKKIDNPPTATVKTEEQKKQPDVEKTVAKKEDPKPLVPTPPATIEKKIDNPPTATVKTEEQKKQPDVEKNVAVKSPVQLEVKPQGAAAFVAQRKLSPPQEVSFKSDSLELVLYDNGEVDGDTVSVLMNGSLILGKQGLKTSPIKKTVFIEPGNNEFTLVLYAENLGKYPPNTGLLVIHDGEETYQVRFSADLQQNAAIIFRRKK